MQPLTSSSLENRVQNLFTNTDSAQGLFGPYTVEVTDISPSQRVAHTQVEAIDPMSYFAEELQQTLLHFLSLEDLSHCALVSKNWSNVIQTAMVEFLKKSKDILENQELRTRLGHMVREHAFLQKQLMDIVTASRENENLGLAPANAITLLNAARVCFSGMNLYGIRIAKAILDGAVFDGTDLQTADLREVRLSNAWLRNAKLGKSQLAGARFRNLPDLKLHKQCHFCCYAFDKEFLLRSFDQTTVEVWNFRKGKCINTFYASSLGGASIQSMTISSDRKFIVIVKTYEIRIHDLQTGKPIHVILHYGANREWLTSGALSSNGKLVATTGDNSETVRVWDLQSRECIHTFHNIVTMPFSIAFSLDGKFLVNGSGDKMVRIWDTQSGECLHFLYGHTHSVLSVTFSADGKYFASGSEDNTVRIWSFHTGQCLHTFSGHEGAVESLAFAPDGKSLASGSRDKTVRIWDLSSGECLQILKGHKGPISQLQFIKEGRQLICFDGWTWRWQIDKQYKLVSLRSTTHPTLFCEGANLKGVIDLDEYSLYFLKHYGASGKSPSKDSPLRTKRKRKRTK